MTEKNQGCWACEVSELSVAQARKFLGSGEACAYCTESLAEYIEDVIHRRWRPWIETWDEYKAELDAAFPDYLSDYYHRHKIPAIVPVKKIPKK